MAAPPRLRPAPTRAGASRLLVDLLAVVGVGLALGGLTSFAQTVLPDALRPFANSASGWTLLTAFTVWARRAGAARSAVLGALGFLALVIGYQVVSDLRGYVTSEELFLVVAVVVGPFVGVAASWLRTTGIRVAIGCALLAGIAVGEATYGLVVVSATTGWFYWSLIGVAGLALLGLTLRGPGHTRRDRVAAAALTLLVGAGFFVAYSVLGGTL